MMRVMVPTYTLRIEVKDPMPTLAGNFSAQGSIQSQGVSSEPSNPQKYWNGRTGATGCDHVVDVIKKALGQAGVTDFTVFFEKFEHV